MIADLRLVVSSDPDTLDGDLERVAPSPLPGEVIGKLASSRFFVFEHASVYDVARGLEKNPDIHGVGVVNRDKTPVGIILRQELFDNLGRMYGRDLYKRKLVPDVMRQPEKTFRDDVNILSVSEVLGDVLSSSTSLYYALVDGSGRYSGLFSTIDLLIYLSKITSRDILLARRLQSSIVKQSISFSGKCTTVVGSSTMAKEVGGDFYVLKRLTDGKLLIAICDVSGKGIAASLITAVLGGFFDFYTTSGTLESFVSALNRYILDTFSLEYFVTGIVIEFDEDAGKAVICDMGHSYMVVVECGNLRRLSSEGANPPLGVVADLTPVTRTYRLKPGSLVLLFTDGVTDQTDNSGHDYTEKRLWKLLKAKGDVVDPGDLSATLSADLSSFRGEAPQRDDITFLVMKYDAPSSSGFAD